MLLDHKTLEGLKKVDRIRVKCDRCYIELEKQVNSIISQRLHRNSEDICKRCSTIEYNKTRPIEVRKKAGAGFTDKYKGKKLEDIVGKEKASSIKLKMSIASHGDKNSNFGGKYSRGFADHPIIGSWELRYGKEKSDKMKSDNSKRASGEGNPMYGKPSPKKAGNGISGRYRGIYFRSLLELSYMLKLDSENIKFLSCESIGKRFDYELNGIKRTYHPDFYLPITNEYIEIKPSSMLRNLEVNIKANAVIKMGEKITFITEKDIIKINKEDLIKIIESNSVIIDTNKQWRVKC